MIRLPDPSRMQVVLRINESLVKYVEQGLRDSIRPIGFERPLPGIITRVEQYAEPQSWPSAILDRFATGAQPPTKVLLVGDSVAFAASMIANPCSMLLMLKAGTPYPCSAAWSSSCLSVMRAMSGKLLFVGLQSGDAGQGFPFQ